MITDKELDAYRNLYSALVSLQEKYLSRRDELFRILSETAVIKRKALVTIMKANNITWRLTSGQRQTAGINYSYNDMKRRLDQIHNSLVMKESVNAAVYKLPEKIPAENLKNSSDLKQSEIQIITVIDGFRKKILQFDLLELRCRELIQAINKSLEAFRHESKITRGKLYPCGIFSMCRRSVRGVFGTGYFTHQDMKELSALGSITFSVLKIADCRVA